MGEVFAALGHAPAEDVSATDGPFTREEAVLAFAFPLGGLVLCATSTEADGELVEGRRGSEGCCWCGEQPGEGRRAGGEEGRRVWAEETGPCGLLCVLEQRMSGYSSSGKWRRCTVQQAEEGRRDSGHSVFEEKERGV